MNRPYAFLELHGCCRADQNNRRLFPCYGEANAQLHKRNTDVGLNIEAKSVPFFPEAKELAETGMVPGGLHRNREFRKDMVDISEDVPQYLADVLFDPQTSGGLLIAVPEPKAAKLLEKLHKAGVTEAAIIGEVVGEPKRRIRVK